MACVTHIGDAGMNGVLGHVQQELVDVERADLQIGRENRFGWRGSDELGLLAGTLAELLERVNDDVRREQIRTAQERDQWHAVGHEIMSPLQSLMVLHGSESDPSHRYVQRMQQAVRVLYGTASPGEAIDRIFEYGVSDQEPAAGSERRGQGLFVARTYMAKMGGTIVARNEDGGDGFVLGLPRVPG